MHLRNGTLHFSASDLANHLACRHLTQLDRRTAEKQLEPPRWEDPLLEVLQQRGFEHERAYLEHLRLQGKRQIQRITDVKEEVGTAFERTCAAMRAGADVIVQAVLESPRCYGRADVLLKVEAPSQLGPWSYEVVDTKLARDTRAGTILQLCFYSAIVDEIQGVRPARMHVVSPGNDYEAESYRLEDYMAYYRFVRARLQETIKANGKNGHRTYPDPTLQCDICRWWPRCDTQRREDDHLCLVAGMGRLQQRELQDWGVGTLTSLAGLPLPITHRPQRGSRQTYERLREQARLQLEARRLGAPTYELLLPIEPGQGLARLPEPSPGDVFLDLEGDAFVGTGGLDYLFGYAVVEADESPAYRGLWALTPTQEQARFEELMQFLLERWECYPGMHIYHYAPYEPSAFKRLMGRYGTQEDGVDRLLRAERFIDLHAVVKRAMRAGVEKYSIKDLEPLFGFQREVDLRQASWGLRALEHALELGQQEEIEDTLRATVETYNRDDCLAAWRLRQWLEGLREQLMEQGHEIPRPALEEGDPSEALDAKRLRVRELAQRLIQDVPVDPGERSPEQHARWLLAQMLEWHRREAKAPWWEYYRLIELTDEELLEERAAIAGLRFVERLEVNRRIPTDRYAYPPQEHLILRKEEVHTADGEHFGKVIEVDVVARTIDIKKTKATAELHPSAIFEHTLYRTEAQEDSLMRLAEWVAENGINAEGPYRAARDLLLRIPPRLASLPGQIDLPFEEPHAPGAQPLEKATPPSLQRPDEPTLEAAKRLGMALDSGVLPVQGPPGSGKTYAGARMIVELVRQGKQVGVTAMSHAVIRNLLDEVEEAAGEARVPLRIVQKTGSDSKHTSTQAIDIAGDNAEVEKALRDGRAQVAGGTSWLWSRPEFFESVDVLVVDEAGQMSLANVLAVAQAGKSLVLIGDPQQLEQPLKGTHPEGADTSALEHLIQDPFRSARGDGTLPDGAAKPRTVSSRFEPAQTVPPDRGLFLSETWRLHPSICGFTSELFYEGRLRSHGGLEKQAIGNRNGSSSPLPGAEAIAGAGLWFVPVEHEGNRSSSPEEVDVVARLVASLLRLGAFWVDARGVEQPMQLEHLLIVAPYNAQVAAIGERLPEARVGTVDKFQGQEAPVVIYSMTTSTADEAPRGMEFLYSLNRFNVATSRARGACILVANPKLLEPECRTPRQIRLANAFCRYLEMATTLE